MVSTQMVWLRLKEWAETALFRISLRLGVSVSLTPPCFDEDPAPPVLMQGCQLSVNREPSSTDSRPLSRVSTVSTHAVRPKHIVNPKPPNKYFIYRDRFKLTKSGFSVEFEENMYEIMRQASRIFPSECSSHQMFKQNHTEYTVYAICDTILPLVIYLKL